MGRGAKIALPTQTHRYTCEETQTGNSSPSPYGSYASMNVRTVSYIYIYSYTRNSQLHSATTICSIVQQRAWSTFLFALFKQCLEPQVTNALKDISVCNSHARSRTASHECHLPHCWHISFTATSHTATHEFYCWAPNVHEYSTPAPSSGCAYWMELYMLCWPVLTLTA